MIKKKNLQFKALLVILALNLTSVFAQFKEREKSFTARAFPFKLSEVRLLESPFRRGLAIKNI